LQVSLAMSVRAAAPIADRQKNKNRKLSVERFLDREAKVGEASDDEGNEENEDLFGENADEPKKKKKKRRRNRISDNEEEEEEDADNYEEDDFVVSDFQDADTSVSIHRQLDMMVQCEEETNLMANKPKRSIALEINSKSKIFEFVTDLANHSGWNFQDFYEQDVIKRICHDLCKNGAPWKMPETVQTALLHVVAASLYMYYATKKPTADIITLLQSPRSEQRKRFQDHISIRKEWQNSFKCILKKQAERIGERYAWMTFIDLATNEAVLLCRSFSAVMPEEMPKIYHCMVTGRILEPKEEVYVLVLQQMGNNLFYYVSRYSNPECPRLYLDAVTNLFELVNPTGLIFGHIKKFEEKNPTHPKSYSSIYQRMVAFMQDERAPLDLFCYFTLAYNFLCQTFLCKSQTATNPNSN